MSSYTVIEGDTFESISRKIYGDERRASLVLGANPEAETPLIPGTVLLISDLSLRGMQAEEEESRQFPVPPVIPRDDVSGGLELLIDGQRFRFWSEIQINSSLDRFSTVEFSAPFDADSELQREIFRPFSFQLVEVQLNGDSLFVGYMVGVTPDLESDRRTVSIFCYSVTGILNDCTPPAVLFNRMEYLNADLRVITDALIEPFSLTSRFDAGPGAIFRQVRCDPQQRVFSFLSELAKQRNLVIGNTPQGELLFSNVVSGSAQPVATLQQGSSPVTSISVAFDSQQYYSHITGIAPLAVGRVGSNYTVKNPRLNTVVRPFNFNAKDSIDADIPEATRNKASRMFGDSVVYTISVNNWRTVAGDIWSPNTLVRVHAPGAMVYQPYTFMIRDVSLVQTPDARTASLTVVIPGSFGGTIPEVLPWD